MSCRRPLWNVLKTSWLENPRRSRARERSSAMKDPVAAKFLRAMISASSSARYSGEACRARSASKAAIEVALLVGRVAGLAQLVPARVAQDGHAVPVGRFRVVPQPGRRLHDVGVGVVDDPALGVGHVFLPPSRTPLVPWWSWRVVLRVVLCVASIPGSGGAPPGSRRRPTMPAWVRSWSRGCCARWGCPPPWSNGWSSKATGQLYATPFPVVECAASVLGCIGAAASLLWEERTGEAQPVTRGPRARRGVPGRVPAPAARGRRTCRPRR